MKTYNVILIFGEQVSRLGNDASEVLEELKKAKREYGSDFLNQYQLKQQVFPTYQEKEAYLIGVQHVIGEDESVVCVYDEALIPSYVELFEQRLFTATTTYADQVKAISKHVNDIIEGGWIPFVSPAPSSTESVIKNQMYAAKEALEKVSSLVR